MRMAACYDGHRRANIVRIVSLERGERGMRPFFAALPHTESTAMATRKNRYIPALDGLRAFAVLAVIAYHMDLPFARGGLLGVTVFFVLSGYLITSLLLVEWNNTGGIDLKNFWLRRVRRLLPAIVLVLTVSAAVFTLLNHELLTKLRTDLIPALLWFTNWWYIFQDVSYFQALGAPSPVTHFWSLAIEEQFYVVWPLLLLGMMRGGAKHATLRRVTVVLAAASAALMAILYDPLGDPSRVYYGTDTRAFSLLIGAWMAFVWPAYELDETSGTDLNKSDLALFDGVGALACLALLGMVVFVDDYSPFLYRGGLLLASFATAVVIAVMVHPRSRLGKAAGCAPLVWIGKRSYGMYLWHYPILLLMNPRNSTSEPNPAYLALQLAIIIAVSELSYRFVENPVRKGRLGELFREFRSKQLDPAQWIKERKVQAACTLAVFIVASAGLAFVPPTSALNDMEALQQQAEEQPRPFVDQPGESAEEPWKYDPLMIGDSVSLRAVPTFQNVYPGGFLDASVNRQLAEGITVFEAYRSQDAVGDHVVIALGTNGVMTEGQLKDFVESIGQDKQVYLVNVRTPNAWEDSVNQTIASVASQFENVVLLDWYAASAGHDEYFDGDGTHLTEVGCSAYIGLVHDAVGDTPAPPAPEIELPDNDAESPLSLEASSPLGSAAH